MSIYKQIVHGKIRSIDLDFTHFQHYTSLEGVKGIWDSNSIWASNIRFLNDSSEYNYISNVLKDVLSERNDEESAIKEYVKQFTSNDIGNLSIPQLFVISFSTVKDSLSQWRAYGSESCGFSLNFNPTFINEFVNNFQDKCPFKNVQLSKCIYKVELQKQIINELLDEYLVNSKDDLCRGILTSFYMKFNQIAPRIKHPKFYEENEWRIIIEVDPLFPIKHRNGKSYLIPYVELNLNNLNDATILDSITIGPTIDMKLTRHSISSLLGMTELNIEETEIPYRNW